MVVQLVLLIDLLIGTGHHHRRGFQRNLFRFDARGELVFLFASSIIQNIPKMKEKFTNLYPTHLMHKYR